MNNDDILKLKQHLRDTLCEIPIDSWGYFFPCLVAAWRLIHSTHSEILGSLDASFNGEPVFRGPGAKWFCESLANNPEFIGAEEAIMYPHVPLIPPNARNRGFLRASELPELPESAIQRMAAAIETELQLYGQK